MACVFGLKLSRQLASGLGLLELLLSSLELINLFFLFWNHKITFGDDGSHNNFFLLSNNNFFLLSNNKFYESHDRFYSLSNNNLFLLSNNRGIIFKVDNNLWDFLLLNNILLYKYNFS
jgi:hypothetical protein